MAQQDHASRLPSFLYQGFVSKADTWRAPSKSAQSAGAGLPGLGTPLPDDHGVGARGWSPISSRSGASGIPASSLAGLAVHQERAADRAGPALLGGDVRAVSSLPLEGSAGLGLSKHRKTGLNAFSSEAAKFLRQSACSAGAVRPRGSTLSASLLPVASCQGHASVGAPPAALQSAEPFAARPAAATGEAVDMGPTFPHLHPTTPHNSSGRQAPNANGVPVVYQHPEHEHQPPPDSDLGFAEDACVPEEDDCLKPAPRLTVASICKSLFAGGVAGAVSRTAVAPLERLKILQQVQSAHGGTAQYTGMWQGLKKIWVQEGFKGLFKGNGVNCARIVPNSAVKFFAYEEASQALLWAVREQSGDPGAELTPLLRLGAGATAGIIAMSATYPMDMVRGRLTVQSESAGARRYRNMMHAMATVWREEGPTALYRGWLPSVIGVIPYVGLNFAVYETLKDWTVKHYTRQELEKRREADSSREPSAAAADLQGPQAGSSARSPVVPNVELSVVTKLGCGAVAGTIGQTVAYPLDVVRRRLQMVGWKDASAPVLSADGKMAVAPQYTGMVDAFKKTVQHEGFGALYRGLLPNCVKVVPSIAIAFVSYELMKDLLGVEIRISD